MQVPGRAWPQSEVEPAEGGSRITQTAVFDPLGLGGLLYWYGLYPIHWLIFQRMLRGVVARGRPVDVSPNSLVHGSLRQPCMDPWRVLQQDHAGQDSAASPSPPRRSTRPGGAITWTAAARVLR